MEVIELFERGLYKMELVRQHTRSMDDDGFVYEDEYWECIVGNDAFSFATREQAEDFIAATGWTTVVY